jgi:glucose-6-phosphate isomerase
MLIALYERVVGLYASLIGINAYHQPGVEAGKKAAGGVIALKLKLEAALKAYAGQAHTAEALATKVGGDPELAFKILEHLAANGAVKKTPAANIFESTYAL